MCSRQKTISSPDACLWYKQLALHRCIVYGLVNTLQIQNYASWKKIILSQIERVHIDKVWIGQVFQCLWQQANPVLSRILS